MVRLLNISIIILSLSLVQVENSLSNTCKIDSINNIKYEYNEINKVSRIWYEVYYNEELIEATLYKDIHYNDNNLIESLTTYTINHTGDTISGPYTYMPFEYTDTLITRIVKSSIIYDDIVYNENNQIVEFKYYYLDNGIIDSSLTRIHYFTYSNGNIINSIYQGITGYLYHNLDYEYDNKINPFYQSEIALLDEDLFKYSCKNNWNYHSGNGNYATTAIRVIEYNEFDYPVLIETSYNNGNSNSTSIKYDCSNSGSITIPENDELIIYPNPSDGNFYLKNEIFLNFDIINIYDISGHKVNFQVLLNKLIVQPNNTGYYLIELKRENKIIRKKLFIYIR